MIAPIETQSTAAPVHRQDTATLPLEENNYAETNPVERVLASAKSWVGNHPTAAVVTSVTLGLLLGYIVKRR